MLLLRPILHERTREIIIFRKSFAKSSFDLKLETLTDCKTRNSKLREHFGIVQYHVTLCPLFDFSRRAISMKH